MYGDKVDTRDKSDNMRVGKGGFGFGGDVDGGPGGGADVRDVKCNGRLIKWGGYCSKHHLMDRA